MLHIKLLTQFVPWPLLYGLSKPFATALYIDEQLCFCLSFPLINKINKYVLHSGFAQTKPINRVYKFLMLKFIIYIFPY